MILDIDKKIKDNIFVFGFIFFIVVSVFSIFFSPLFLFILSFLGILFLSPLLNNFFIRLLFVNLVFLSLLIVVGSRNYYAELSSDLLIYGDVYDMLDTDVTYALNFFGGGLEIGWPLVYSVIKSVVELTPIQQSLVNIIFSVFVVLCWVEFKLRPLINKNEIGVFYFIFFIFINIGVLGYLQRQGLTLGLLLFALTSKNNARFIFFVLIASFFHLSSLLVGLVLYICKKITLDKIKILYILFYAIIFRILFFVIISYMLPYLSSFSFISTKVNYFEDLNFRISTLRYTILFLFLFFILFIIKKVDDEKKSLYNLGVISSIFIISFAGIPLFADRVFMIGMIIYGVFYYLFFFVNHRKVGLIFALLYFLIIFMERFNIIGGLASGDFYWARYFYLGEEILYYLDRI